MTRLSREHLSAGNVSVGEDISLVFWRPRFFAKLSVLPSRRQSQEPWLRSGLLIYLGGVSVIRLDYACVLTTGRSFGEFQAFGYNTSKTS